ncbi:MAG: hypothetical protein K0S32_2411 [Bacteroidetes bacterium]|jgi:hypothetical protein|nr:hypothetical protein [Bacteroidota bacterium]
MRAHNILQLFVLLSIFISCSSSDSPNKSEPVKVATDTLKKDSATVSTTTETTGVTGTPENRFNYITAVLCGDKGKAGDLNYLFDTLAWKNHSKFIDSSWKRLEKKRLVAMQNWGRKEFEQANSQAKMVFYPFSGPDYLTAHAFFPNADKYVMLGLEPVGKLPDLKKFKAVEASDYSQDFKKSLGDIFDKSYFITKKMLNDFQSQKVNGLLPVLAFFIRKSGNEILDVKYLVRYNQDSISEVNYDFKDNDHKPFGVRVDFLQEGKQKSVYYFKYDVSDKQFNDTTVFYKYIDKNSANCITYLKSASYLLHANFMSNMRKLIIRNSIAVVQDDTGIPFKYFEEGKNFDIKLYGAYTKPVSDFPYLSLQKPLQEAFKKDSANVGKLPFHLGYHWGTKKDVIIYAKKK